MRAYFFPQLILAVALANNAYAGPRAHGGPPAGGSSPPTISSVIPSNGSLAGTTYVVISGTGFTGTTCPNVKFGGVAVNSCVVTNAQTIKASTPSGAAGAVNVAVTNANGTATLTNGFTYAGLSAPTVAGANDPNGTALYGTETRQMVAHIVPNGGNLNLTGVSTWATCAVAVGCPVVFIGTGDWEDSVCAGNPQVDILTSSLGSVYVDNNSMTNPGGACTGTFPVVNWLGDGIFDFDENGAAISPSVDIAIAAGPNGGQITIRNDNTGAWVNPSVGGAGGGTDRAGAVYDDKSNSKTISYLLLGADGTGTRNGQVHNMTFQGWAGGGCAGTASCFIDGTDEAFCVFGAADCSSSNQCYSLTSVSVNASGSGYAVNNTITLSQTGTQPFAGTSQILTVSSISAGGHITGVTITDGGGFKGGALGGTTFTQASTSGGGTGATFNSGVYGLGGESDCTNLPGQFPNGTTLPSLNLRFMSVVKCPISNVGVNPVVYAAFSSVGVQIWKRNDNDANSTHSLYSEVTNQTDLNNTSAPSSNGLRGMACVKTTDTVTHPSGYVLQATTQIESALYQFDTQTGCLGTTNTCSNTVDLSVVMNNVWGGANAGNKTRISPYNGGDMFVYTDPSSGTQWSVFGEGNQLGCAGNTVRPYITLSGANACALSGLWWVPLASPGSPVLYPNSPGTTASPPTFLNTSAGGVAPAFAIAACGNSTNVGGKCVGQISTRTVICSPFAEDGANSSNGQCGQALFFGGVDMQGGPAAVTNVAWSLRLPVDSTVHP